MATPTKGTIHDPSWRAFAAWCRRLRLRPLPAHPWTVAAFLRWCDDRPGAATVSDALGAIASVHKRRRLARPERDDIVLRTVAAIERQHPGQSGVVIAALPVKAARPAKPLKRQIRVLRATPKLIPRRHYRTTH